MPVTRKGTIAFGLVYIPVEIHSATQKNDSRFNQLHKGNLTRIRYKKMDIAPAMPWVTLK